MSGCTRASGMDNPSSEVPPEFLDSSTKQSKSEGTAIYDIVPGNAARAQGAATVFTSSHSEPALAGLTKLDFDAMHAWFEEDEQVYVHPKDPYKCADVLQSSRHVRIEVNGVEVANTHKPRFLYETTLPVRTYIPKTDCRLDLLVPTSFTTAYPYKVGTASYKLVGIVGLMFYQGVANYYSVKLDKDQIVENVWWHRNPTVETAAIGGYIAFEDEKVDVWIDGEKQERPGN
ncbi:hypothetical protein D9758_013084 [Tetrapyrgos nigripes]|uniref:DUF427 domain-containing protein n=1 Tax=Tetrapyrgos nigripes TaxID=182062 RepID=A0A8H5CAI8_9AGAR|nr:hypothetical protein D9758_013084 [Tetrapyrgos nigripes]